MRILVTGSSGFIGGHLVRTLLRAGHTVQGIGLHQPSKPNSHDFHVCDVLDIDALGHRLQTFSPHVVVHLAARTDLDESAGMEAYAPNTRGVENLIEVISESRSVTRCIYTSSQLVCKLGYIPTSEEDYQPNTVYGRSKMEMEKTVRRGDGGGAVWCIVRPTTVWGPGMSAHYRSFFSLIDRGLYFHIGQDRLYKSFGYVGNVVHQILRLVEAPQRQIHRKTLYLADYEPISLRRWVNGLQQEMGAPPVKTIPLPVARAAARVGDLINVMGLKRYPYNSFRLNNVLTEYQLDMSETEAVCGPLPFTCETGIIKTVAWLRSTGTV